MPQQRTFQDIVPRADTRDRRIHHHKPAGALGVTFGKGKGDHVSDVVPDDVGAFHIKRVQNAGDILGLIPFLETSVRNRR